MDKRTILAVSLSLLVLISWTFLFPQKQQAPPAVVSEKTEPGAPSPAQTETVKATAATPAQGELAAAPSETDNRAIDITVETDKYKAVFSNLGATIKYWELKSHKENDKPVVLLKEPGVMPPLGIILESPDRNLPQKLLYTTNTDNISLSGKGDATAELIFTASDGVMSIRKKLTFHNNAYKVDLSIETTNAPSFKLPVGTDFGVFDKTQREHSGPVLLANTDRKEYKNDLKSPEYFTGKINWAAQEDKYFTAALIPLTEVEGAEVWMEGGSAEIAYKLKSGINEFVLYAGPKEYDRLKEFNAGLEHIIDFGWFAFIAMPLFWVLKFLYNYLGNYGWAIIILTIAVRVPFIPILMKSQQSMKKMAKIQPLMAELKEKYSKDPAKMQKETMALYKKHKVNPVGGCLPMFLQIPVFLALYNVLLRAIELRGAPFVFWITDLAAKDPYYVFPIVMGATMVIQQKMTPSAMDPKQAKMMMLMPIVFTFMFLSFPAGLVLYWLVNNVLGIAQQYYSNKKAD